jgi:hypothetical protein
MTTGDMFTYNGRIIVGFGGVCIILALFPWLVVLPIGVNYYVCFIVLIFYGAFSGIGQGSVFTMAANLPFKYMGAVMLGNGISAISCNILRAITIASFPVYPEDPART